MRTRAGAVKAPSASLPPMASASGRPAPDARPRAKLRDCGDDAVSTRSPKPDRPISVSGRAPNPLAKSAQFGKAARDDRGARALAEPGADDDAGGNRQHVLGRPADLDAGHIIGVVDAQTRTGDQPRPRCRARSRSGAASVTAVGRPRMISAAKLGPDRTAGPRRARSRQGWRSRRSPVLLDALGCRNQRRSGGNMAVQCRWRRRAATGWEWQGSARRRPWRRSGHRSE
jgi:hypothetical protein